MATLAHDVFYVHGVSSLYIKTCWRILYRVFPIWRMGESSHPQPKIYSFTPSPPNVCQLPPKVNPTKKQKLHFSCSHCSCTILVLISYCFEIQTILILILIHVHYSQNAVFSFENFSKKSLLLRFSTPVKKIPSSSVHQFLTQSQGNS